MELHNKLVKKLVIKGMKKTKINYYLLEQLKVQSKTNLTYSDQTLERLNTYSKNPMKSSVFIGRKSNWNEKKTYKIAIIVPVYNGEKYIQECLESLINQVTEYKYQIILVNDGSKDGTADLIEKYLPNSKILYIEQKNKGLSGARNTGLELVDAEYVTFVDSDDYVSNDLVQLLINAAELNHADIVQGSFEKFVYKKGINKKVTYGNGCIENAYAVSGFAWAKVFKASLFKEIQFPEGYWFEDSIMSHLIFGSANKVMTISNIVYYYRTNLSGISRTSIKSRKCIDSSWLLEQMLISRQKLGLVNNQRYLNFFLGQVVINYRREFNVEESIKESVFLYTVNLYQTYFDMDLKCSMLSKPKQKLLLALKNADFNAYEKICMLT